MASDIKVTRTVRVHEAPNRRFVRLTGDGTPENTRITDMHGNPIPEAVLSVKLEIRAGECAHGSFRYYLPPNPGADDFDFDEFEAWVVFEAPPRPPAGVGYAELALELEAAREEIAVQRERIAAASFALGDGAARGASACDTRVPGPSAGELLDIMDPPAAPSTWPLRGAGPMPVNAAGEPTVAKSEHVIAADGAPYESGLFEADPEGPPDPMAQRMPPPAVPDWAEQPAQDVTTRTAPTVRGEPFDIGDHAEGSRLRERDVDDG